MSAAVATIPERPSLVVGHRPAAIVPTSMDEAWRLGKAIVMAGMAPRGMETAEKCMIAIMRGMEVGLTPMQAVDKIAIVNGRPTIWGDGAIGLVRGSGLCEYVDETTEGEGDARTASCVVKRRGEIKPVRRTFSVADAKKAGLWNKSGPWQQFPDRMLQMRARAFALRDLFADVLGGLYLREEIEEDRPTRETATARHSDGPPPAPAIPASRRNAIEHQSTAGDSGLAPAVEDAGPPEANIAPVEDGSASDNAEAERAQTTEEILADLADRLAFAKTEEEVAEFYDDQDPEATLSNVEGGVEAARAVRGKALGRVSAAAVVQGAVSREQPPQVSVAPAAPVVDLSVMPTTWAGYLGQAEHVLATLSGREAMAWFTNGSDLRPRLKPTGTDDERKALKDRFVAKKRDAVAAEKAGD